MTGKKATDQWYEEIKDFDFANKTFSPNTGHFTQVVWKESIEVGAGIATAKNGWTFCVARYAVAGNLKGAFDNNIGDVGSEPQNTEHMDFLREEVTVLILLTATATTTTMITETPTKITTMKTMTTTTMTTAITTTRTTTTTTITTTTTTTMTTETDEQ